MAQVSGVLPFGAAPVGASSPIVIKLNNGRMLVLEIKVEDSEQNKAKRAALNFWV